ncbi:MAG TPA: LCP family protein [Acidimicrobiia bacterium]|nr:LCP family protein [Acidimicrobiia bacterium]
MSSGRVAARPLLRVVLGRFALALAVALPLVLAGVVGVNVFIDRKIDSIPRIKVKTAADTDPGSPANFLLIGSDTRAFADLSPEEQQAFGSPANAGGQRSDTIMVIHVDPQTRTGFLVSFPRDLEVDIPGVGQQKLNAAFNPGIGGGPQLVIDTLQKDFQVPIQHYLQVDFESFQGIVDAMGGVPIYIAAPSKDDMSGFNFIPFDFHPGCYTLDGGQALAYVRSREMQEYIDGRWQMPDANAPDLGRIQRQQTFLRRLAGEAFHQALKSPLTANDIADKTIPKLTADSTLSRGDIDKLITSFRTVDPNDPNSLQTVTLPTMPGPTSKTLGSVLEPQQPDANAVLARLRTSAPSTLPQQGPKPSEIRVRVFNGSGQGGIASGVDGDLRQQGFVSVGVGNAARTNVTEVHYRSGSLDKARVVQSYLGGTGRLVEDKNVVEADVALVLGRDFKAVTPPPGAAPPESTTALAPAPTAAPGTTGPKGKPPLPDPTQC